MKTLVITGKQGTGKSELGHYFAQFEMSYVIDGATLNIIRNTKKGAHPIVFITNEEVGYHQLDSEKYLIIRLTALKGIR